MAKSTKGNIKVRSRGGELLIRAMSKAKWRFNDSGGRKLEKKGFELNIILKDRRDFREKKAGGSNSTEPTTYSTVIGAENIGMRQTQMIETSLLSPFDSLRNGVRELGMICECQDETRQER